MNYKIYHILFVTGVLIFGCKDQKTTEDPQDVKNSLSEISKIDIDEISYTDYVLSDASLKATADWTQFHELEKEIINLKQARLSFFKDDAKVLKTFIENLNKTTPETINREDVTTRITAIENAMYYLFSELNLNRQDKNLSLKAIKSVLVSVSNLKLQINKKLELDGQNITKPE